jgi:AcrR family transcriptional regulator
VPRTKEQNEALRAERKMAILNGALKVYIEKGYAAAEIGDVAKHAGVARGLVYYYYQDKLTLFRELFRYMFERSNVHVRDFFSQTGSVFELFEQFVREMYSNVFDNSDHILFFFRMRHDIHELFKPEEIGGLHFRDAIFEVMIDKLKKGMAAAEIRVMSPDILVYQYWGAMMHGMMLLRQRNEQLLKKDDSPETVRELLEPDIRDAVLSCTAMLRPHL